MSDDKPTNGYGEDKKYILSELEHVNGHLEKLDDNFSDLRIDIKDSNKLLIKTLQEQVQIPTRAILTHEDTCRQDKHKLWQNIYGLQKSLAVHKAQVGIWAGIGSFVVATVVSLTIVFAKTWLTS